MNNISDAPANSQIMEYLKNLESRVSKIELKLGIEESEKIREEFSEEKIKPAQREGGLESQFGEMWFANAGVLILTIGLTFLLTLPYNNINSLIPAGIGFMFSVGLYYISKKIFDKQTLLSNQLWFAGALLSFFSALRLFHFSDNPLFENDLIEAVALLSVSGSIVITSRSVKSATLVAFSLALVNLGLLAIDSIYLFMVMNTLLAGIFVYFFLINQKTPFIIFGIFITSLFHLIWTLNNPFFSDNQIQIITEPSFFPLLPILYVLIFAMPYAAKYLKSRNEESLLPITLINISTGWILFQFSNMHNIGGASYAEQLIAFAALLILSLSIFFKLKQSVIASIYAIAAFGTLSIGIIAFTELPDVYTYLIWQSLLVIGIAILFRSKNVVVLNFMMFVVIFLAFLAAVSQFNLISISFGIVALISARILNWQKDRLTIKTEMIRNSYLAIAFIAIPFTLLKAIPINYIGLSWLAVAVVYYILSTFLNNTKYRWMAHFTLLAAIIFSATVGISQYDPMFRIITFISLGLALVVVSIFLARTQQAEGDNQETESSLEE